MREFFYFVKWFVLVKIFKKKIPFNGAIIINDLCNLNCKHCTVSSRNGKNVKFKQIEEDLTSLYAKGIRFLEITGGEPFLYKDNKKNLEEIIKLAKKSGFTEYYFALTGPYQSKHLPIMFG